MNYLIKNNKIYRKGTLAHFLDKRTVSIEEPTAEDLPKVINPFKFIYTNLLKNSCVIIKLKHSELQYSTELLYLLEDITPTGQYIFIYIDVDDISERIKLDALTKVTSYQAACCEESVPLIITSSAIATPLEETCE